MVDADHFAAVNEADGSRCESGLERGTGRACIQALFHSRLYARSSPITPGNTPLASVDVNQTDNYSMLSDKFRPQALITNTVVQEEALL